MQEVRKSQNQHGEPSRRLSINSGKLESSSGDVPGPRRACGQPQARLAWKGHRYLPSGLGICHSSDSSSLVCPILHQLWGCRFPRRGTGRTGLTIGQTGQMPGASRFWGPRLSISKHSFTLEHKTGIDLTVSLTLRKPSKNDVLFWNVSDYS